MAYKYFRATIGTRLNSTFRVVYSTELTPTVFDHTAEIYDESSNSYSTATGLTYDQLTGNGGAIVRTDDDVYKLKIEDENNYCTDCVSSIFGSSTQYIQFYIGEGTAIPPNSEPDTGANITVTITNVLQSGGGTAPQTYSVDGSGGVNDVQPLLQFRSGDEITITVTASVSHPNTDEDLYFDCYDSINNNIGTGEYETVNVGIKYVHTLTMPSEDLSCDIYLSSTWL